MNEGLTFALAQSLWKDVFLDHHLIVVSGTSPLDPV